MQSDLHVWHRHHALPMLLPPPIGSVSGYPRGLVKWQQVGAANQPAEATASAGDHGAKSGAAKSCGSDGSQVD